MKKFNPMFQLREKNELKNMYKKAYFFVSIIALLLVLIPLLANVGFYQTPKAPLIAKDFLTMTKIKPIVALILITYGVAITIFIVACNIFFKNSAKLSMLNAILASIFLFLNFFAYLAYAKGVFSGYLITGFSFGFGGVAFILTSLVLLGHEFYKMGWEGYYVVVETPADNQKLLTGADNEADVVEVLEPVTDVNANENDAHEIVVEVEGDVDKGVKEPENDVEGKK